MKCNVILDLLPSYVDHICSQDTAELVEKHISHCQDCKQALRVMESPDCTENVYGQEEMMRAKKPFQAIRKKYRTKIFIAAMLSILLTLAGYQVVQNIGVIHRTVLPMLCVTVNASSNTAEWQPIHFNDSEFLVFDSVFYHKTLTNSANSTGAITLQIKDTDGQVLMKEKKLVPGETIELELLQLNTPYIVSAKYGAGQFFINVA